MSNEKMMTMTAFRQATGASESTVGRWITRGLPCVRIPRAGGGRAQLFFPHDEALSWAAAHGNRTAQRQAIALAKKSTAAAANESPGPAANGKPSTPIMNVEDEGLIPALERLKRQEIESHRLLIRLKRAGDLNGVLAVSERHLAETKALAVLENAAVSFRTRIGELAPAAAMRDVFVKVVVGVKNNLLGVPNAVIPLILPYLKDEASARAIYKIIDDKIRGALRALKENRTPTPEPPPPPLHPGP